MHTTSFTIRPATCADAPFIAQGVLTAIGWNMFDPATATHYQQSLAELTPICRRTDTLYSWRNTLIAECGTPCADMPEHHAPSPASPCTLSDDTLHPSDAHPADRRAGILVSYDGGLYHSMRRLTFSLLPSFSGVSVEDMADETTAGEYYMDSLCVWPQYRGHALGRQLLEAAIARARSMRLTPTLLVDPDNAPAKRLYASLGFQPAGQVVAFGHLYERRVVPAQSSRQGTAQAATRVEASGQAGHAAPGQRPTLACPEA